MKTSSFTAICAAGVSLVAFTAAGLREPRSICANDKVKDYREAYNLFAIATVELDYCRLTDSREDCKRHAKYEKEILAQTECFITSSEIDLRLGIIPAAAITVARDELKVYLDYRNGTTTSPMSDPNEPVAPKGGAYIVGPDGQKTFLANE